MNDLQLVSCILAILKRGAKEEYTIDLIREEILDTYRHEIPWARLHGAITELADDAAIDVSYTGVITLTLAGA